MPLHIALFLLLGSSFSAPAHQISDISAKGWKCFGIWQPSSESAMVLGCPQNIIAQVSEGIFEVRHLVRVTPQKCVYDEVNSAPEIPGTRIIACDKPKN